jgi:hypothetical protein
MRIHHFLILLIFTIGSVELLHSQQLTKDAKISLMTGTPGDQLYNCFGHSAIRIEDPNLRMDFLYNYGTFDFDTPNFYLKFVQRKLLYTLSKSSYRGLALLYEQEGRGIYLQELLLNQEEKQLVFDRLKENYKPENREYLYDFFYDNCATRIRDILQDGLGEDLDIPNEEGTKRFRAYLDEYLEPTPWMDLGIDIILGLEADKKADSKAQMFLPDYLADNLAKATYKGKPLLGEKVWTLPLPEVEQSKSFFSPFLVMLLVSLLIGLLSWIARKQKTLTNLIDLSLFSILSIAGLLVAFLWFGTDHIATQYNLSLLWASPLYLLWVFVGWKFKAPAKWVQILAWILLLSNLLALLMLIVPIQKFNIALLPLILLILYRLYHRMGIWGVVPFPKDHLPGQKD